MFATKVLLFILPALAHADLFGDAASSGEPSSGSGDVGSGSGDAPLTYKVTFSLTFGVPPTDAEKPGIISGVATTAGVDDSQVVADWGSRRRRLSTAASASFTISTKDSSTAFVVAGKIEAASPAIWSLATGVDVASATTPDIECVSDCGGSDDSNSAALGLGLGLGLGLPIVGVGGFLLYKKMKKPSGADEPGVLQLASESS